MIAILNTVIYIDISVILRYHFKSRVNKKTNNNKYERHFSPLALFLHTLLPPSMFFTAFKGCTDTIY
jgi:hypothetical protein